MQNNNEKVGHRKIFDSLELMIDGWKMLKLDKRAPEEFKALGEKRKAIGELYGWV